MKLEDFRLEGGQRKTLVVLGAGASRGATFVTSKVGVLPPLDADFFQQLSRMRRSEAVNRLIQFVRSEYGHEAGISMEQFFSEADYTDRFHSELNVDRGPKVRRYSKALDDFYTALGGVLQASTKGDCSVHQLVAGLLHVGDTVLSFNYDCVMDRALRQAAGKRWDPDRLGYGFSVTGGRDHWIDHSSPGKSPKESIRLLKLHGSINWNLKPNDTAIELLHEDNLKAQRGSVIPPTWFKDLAVFPFSDVWKAARVAVRTARVLVVVGYSVPVTDLFSRSLFKVEAGSKAKREKLDLLVLVNPDGTSRQAFVDLVTGGLEPTTRVLELERLADLGELLSGGAP